VPHHGGEISVGAEGDLPGRDSGYAEAELHADIRGENQQCW